MARLILLADDSPQARRMGGQYLTDLGYRVVAVDHGAAALAALAEHHPDLVIADAGLPGLPGAALARATTVPVLVMAGALATLDPTATAGAAGVLRKPLSSAGLEDWLTRLLPDAATAAAAPAPACALETPEAMLLAALRDAVADLRQ